MKIYKIFFQIKHFILFFSVVWRYIYCWAIFKKIPKSFYRLWKFDQFHLQKCGAALKMCLLSAWKAFLTKKKIFKSWNCFLIEMFWTALKHRNLIFFVCGSFETFRSLFFQVRNSKNLSFCKNVFQRLKTIHCLKWKFIKYFFQIKHFILFFSVV